MLRRRLFLPYLAAVAVVLTACGDPGPAPDAASEAHVLGWRSEVRPLLQEHCVGCHAGEQPAGALDLAVLAGAFAPPEDATLRARAAVVEKLVGHVANGLMPPPDEVGPTAAGRAAFCRWWTNALAAAWASAPPDPGRVTMRRLSRYEYRRTVRDLLGVDFPAEEVFPADDVGYGFDHIGDVLSMPPILFEKYLHAAERISRRAVKAPRDPDAGNPPGVGGSARPWLRSRPEVGDERASAERLVRRLLRRAWRRPPTPVEVERHVGLAMGAMADGESFAGALRLALQAVLVSPHFLFRVELDECAGPGTTATPLGDHALASRLSYFLWSSLPDEELDALADAGRLRARLHEQVTRMLAHPRHAALVENFAAQWLELRRLDTVAPDPQRFTTFDEQLRASMQRETELVVAALIREDRSILELLDWPYTYVDARLAQHYGLPPVPDKGFHRVRTAPERAGLLGHASILTLTSYPLRTSPVQRGKWIMDELLGTPPPPPPAGVGVLETEDPAVLRLTLRERLERHRADPSCAVCHDRMDNLGYGLEGFDPIGRLRTPRGAGAIDTAGTLPDGRRFDGPVELRAILKSDPGFPRCFAEKLLTYALGRGLEPYDRPAVLRIVEEARRRDYRFSSFVHAIVATEAFTMRRSSGADR